MPRSPIRDWRRYQNSRQNAKGRRLWTPAFRIHTGTLGICDLPLPRQSRRWFWQVNKGLHLEATIVQDLQLLTCDEVAEILRVSSETVRQLAASGELPGRKIGRAWRFPRIAIESFLLDTTAHAHCDRTGAEGAGNDYVRTSGEV